MTTEDGAKIWTRFRSPATRAKGTVLLNHGMGEHSGRYDHVAAFLTGRGYHFCSYDMRGHGRSEGRNGTIRRYSVLLDDLEAVFRRVSEDFPRPLFLYGHSLGAQIAINFLAQRRPPVQGAILASPWLKLAFQPGRFKLLLARIALLLYPDFTQTTGLDPSRLSRDEEFLASMRDLDLVHRRMSARMYHELVQAGLRALESASKIRLPILLLQGADDPVISAQATQVFFDTLGSPDKTLNIYPGMRHETHNELERECVLADVGNWLDGRS